MRTLMSDESTSYMHYLNFVIECLYIFFGYSRLLQQTTFGCNMLATRKISV
uniref:Uncharacterized protein n=2 Tax=Aegilops tauschii subsp. strangulata TaxID=200361 RepID=A0A453QHB8_AEGTS